MGFYTRIIADWASQLKYADLTREIVEVTKKFILDWLGYTLYSRQEATAVKIRNVILESYGTKDEATILGEGQRTSALAAAFVNGALAHLSEIDDTDFLTQNHPGDSIIAACLAMGEKTGVSGKDLIAAVVAGYEVATRVGLAGMPSHFQKGWHPSGTINTIGACVAAGKVLGFDLSQHIHGIGISSSWASGNFAHVPERGMVKDLDTGRAAHNGLLAAIFAAQGFTSCTDAFENPKGYAGLYADSFNHSMLVEGLGDQYRMLGVGHKVYTACRHASAALDATLLVFSQESINTDEIEDITVTVSPAGYFFINDPEPWHESKGESGSRFSGQFNVAVAALEGEEGLHRLFEKEYVRKKFADQRIRKLVGKIKIVSDESMPQRYPGRWVAGLEVTTLNGKKYSRVVDCPKGEQGNPISWDYLFAKVQKLTAMAGAEKENVQRLCEAVRCLEDVPNVSFLPSLLKINK